MSLRASLIATVIGLLIFTLLGVPHAVLLSGLIGCFCYGLLTG